MKYFCNIFTEDKLKTKYRSLVKTHHPDRGGNTEIMKQINYEYARYLKALKYKPRSLKDVRVGCTVYVNDSKCIVTSVETDRFKAKSLKTFREAYFSKQTGFAMLSFRFRAQVS